MLTWQCRIPGKPGTKWEDGLYPVTLKFTENYPATPPECTFPAGFIHPNVYSNGKVGGEATSRNERLLNCRYTSNAPRRNSSLYTLRHSP